MKLREKTNIEICDENKLPYTILTNVVEENYSKNKMRATSNLIAKALIATLGPYGSSTIIQDRECRHFASKDGYDLMNRMEFEDPVSKTLLDLLRSTASNQVFAVGDGSTSAIVVANALFQILTDPEQRDHFKKVAPKDIVDILNSIEEVLESEIKKISRPISADLHELDTLASIANNNDKTVGKLIADIYRKIGSFGFVTMDVTDKQPTDTYEIKTGVEWDRGYIDPIFSTMENSEKIIYDQTPKIIISNSNLTYDDLEFVLIPLFREAFNQENVELVLIANGYSDDVINFLKANRTKHLQIGQKQIPMSFIAIDIDQVTKESRNKLEDLALMCNCKIYDKIFVQKGEVLKDPKAFIGRAEKVVSTPKNTQVITNLELNENSKEISKRIKDLESELKKFKSIEVPTREDDMKIYELRQRLSRLTSSTAVVHVAGKTMAERMTRQRLIEDAIFACKSALENGYIPGGNLCIPKILLEKKEVIASDLAVKYSYLPEENPIEFFRYFIDTLANAFLESYRAVLNNSYFSEEETEETIKKCLTENKFYNLKMHRFEDFDKTEVINSAQTDIEILKSCISIIGILSTSNQFITLSMNVVDQIRKQ